MTRFAQFSLALVLSACGGGTLMMDNVDNQAFARTMDNLRAEEGQHHDNVMAASSLADIRAEMARHEQNMATIGADMRIRIGHMPAGCGDLVTTRDGMLAMMTRMDTLEAAHDGTMASAATVDDARAECDRHEGASAGIVDELEQGWAGMACMP